MKISPNVEHMERGQVTVSSEKYIKISLTKSNKPKISRIACLKNKFVHYGFYTKGNKEKLVLSSELFSIYHGFVSMGGILFFYLRSAFCSIVKSLVDTPLLRG